jgi:hypothetical protein
VQALRDISCSVDAAVDAIVAREGESAVKSYLLARAQIAAFDKSSAEEVARIREQIGCLESDREAAVADMATPGLGQRLAEIDRRITAAKEAIRAAGAGREALLPIVQRHKEAAYGQAVSEAARAFHHRLGELNGRRMQIIEVIAAKCRAEIAELVDCTAAQVILENTDERVLARGVGMATLQRTRNL